VRSLLGFTAACVFVLVTVTACGALKAAAPTDDAVDDAGVEETDGMDGAPPLPSPADGGDAAKAPTLDADACGVCKASEACTDKGGTASCEPATIVWEVDGVVVSKMASYEAFYTASTGTTSLFFNHYGRNVQISFTGAPTGPVTQCPEGGSASLGLITSDNGWAKLEALPARWKGLTFTACGEQGSGDVVTARDLTLTNASPARVAGHYEILVQGAGPRAGSTLRVHGVFDVTPDPL
jgi:hypothetical protein